MRAKENGRDRRLAALIQRQLAVWFQQEQAGADPELLTVSAVRVGRALASARVFVTCLHDTPERRSALIVSLNEAAPRYRRRLARVLKCRAVPHLKFVYDRFPEDSLRLAGLLGSLQPVIPRDDERWTG